MGGGGGGAAPRLQQREAHLADHGAGVWGEAAEELEDGEVGGADEVEELFGVDDAEAFGVELAVCAHDGERVFGFLLARVPWVMEGGGAAAVVGGVVVAGGAAPGAGGGRQGRFAIVVRADDGGFAVGEDAIVPRAIVAGEQIAEDLLADFDGEVEEGRWTGVEVAAPVAVAAGYVT
ncbi:MAG: hypothetical protein Q9157_006311 [Trypethelium eluteriae]